MNRLNESQLRNMIAKRVRKVLREGFEDDFNSARDKHMSRGGMFGMELKNPEGEWEYGDVTFDPTSNTMSCMGVTIDVDPDCSVDQNLEALYDELMNNGYGMDDDMNESRLDRIISENVKRMLNEAMDSPGTLSYLATELLSNDAQRLRQFGSLEDAKAFIASEVKKLKRTSKEQKMMFLNGTEDYPGIMRVHSLNQMIRVLGNVFLGGKGLGLVRTGIASRRR